MGSTIRGSIYTLAWVSQKNRKTRKLQNKYWQSYRGKRRKATGDKWTTRWANQGKEHASRSRSNEAMAQLTSSQARRTSIMQSGTISTGNVLFSQKMHLSVLADCAANSAIAQSLPRRLGYYQGHSTTPRNSMTWLGKFSKNVPGSDWWFLRTWSIQLLPQVTGNRTGGGPRKEPHPWSQEGILVTTRWDYVLPTYLTYSHYSQHL